MLFSSDDEKLIDIVFDVLATYRLTTLVKDDKITEDLRNLVYRKYGQPNDEDSKKISYLLTCPWCLSVYFGAAAVAGRTMFPKLWKPTAKALTYSALTGLLAEARG